MKLLTKFLLEDLAAQDFPQNPPLIFPFHAETTSFESFIFEKGCNNIKITLKVSGQILDLYLLKLCEPRTSRQCY